MEKPATPLPRCPAKFAALYPGQTPPTYRKLYTLALDGRIPTELRESRIFVLDDDFNKVAAVCGLTIPAEGVAA